MKFYNPLKPHIVEFEDGTYGIRKYVWFIYGSLFSTFNSPMFLDKNDDYWWTFDTVFKHNYSFKTLDDCVVQYKKICNITVDIFDKGKAI